MSSHLLTPMAVKKINLHLIQVDQALGMYKNEVEGVSSANAVHID